MRDSAFSFANSNKACICISSSLYDRRAIDAPAPSLPLVNSLTHLSYLTATSPRIREILSVDGGLERLVKILKRCASTTNNDDDSQYPLGSLKGKGVATTKRPRKSPFKPFSAYVQLPNQSSVVSPASKSKHLLYTYTLAFQCIVNVGVRGSEQIRTRVVEAGALEVVINVLERFLAEVDQKKREAEAARADEPIASSQASSSRRGSFDSLTPAPPARMSTPDTVISNDDATMLVDETGSASGQDGDQTEADDEATCSVPRRTSMVPVKSSSGDDTMTATTEDVTMQDSPVEQSTPASASRPSNGIEFRDEDILLSLQLLAYLSKYPHVRNVFHSPRIIPSSQTDQLDIQTTNLFSLVEKFTHRPAKTDNVSPRFSNEVQYWAGVIMRNACRKDDSRNGIRQCANMDCGVWEKYPREFAKCRRCRKAKYCSKQCQSKAWQLGHRYWCAKAQRKEGESSSSRHHHHHHHHQHHQHQNAGLTAAVVTDFAGDVDMTGTAAGLPPARHQQRPDPRAGPEGDDDDDDDELPITRSPTQDSLPANNAMTRDDTVRLHHHHHSRIHRISNPTLPAGLSVFEGQFEDHGDNVRVATGTPIARDTLWRRAGRTGTPADDDEADVRTARAAGDD